MANIKLPVFTHSFTNSSFIVDDNFLVKKLSITASGGSITVIGTDTFGSASSSAITIPDGSSVTVEAPVGENGNFYYIDDLTITAGVGVTAYIIAI